MIELHLDLTQEEAKVYSVLCEDQGYSVLIMTETLVKNFIERAALVKVEDDRVLTKAYEMQLNHNSKGE